MQRYKKILKLPNIFKEKYHYPYTFFHHPSRAPKMYAAVEQTGHLQRKKNGIIPDFTPQNDGIIPDSTP